MPKNSAWKAIFQEIKSKQRFFCLTILIFITIMLLCAAEAETGKDGTANRVKKRAIIVLDFTVKSNDLDIHLGEYFSQLIRNALASEGIYRLVRDNSLEKFLAEKSGERCSISEEKLIELSERAGVETIVFGGIDNEDIIHTVQAGVIDLRQSKKIIFDTMHFVRPDQIAAICVAIVRSIKGEGMPEERKIEVEQKDIMPEGMVYIPAGEIIMGRNKNDIWSVYVNAFYIDKYEVTNGEYRQFTRATGYSSPYVDEKWAQPYNWRSGTFPEHQMDLPVVLISWKDAEVYAKWKGGRLPSEAEWNKAAISGKGAKLKRSALEWVSDWYEQGYFDDDGPRLNTDGLFRRYKIICSGSWSDDLISPARGVIRYISDPEDRYPYITFRCVRDIK